MRKLNQSGEGGFAAFIVIVVVIIVGVAAWNHIVLPGWNKYVKKYDKPWWTGTSTQRVCGTGEKQGTCYNLDVYSDGEHLSTIYFPNGGHVTATSSECYEAASFYDYDRFCRFWDTEGRVFDVTPLL